MVIIPFQPTGDILRCPECAGRIRHEVTDKRTTTGLPWCDGYCGQELSGLQICPWCGILVWSRDMIVESRFPQEPVHQQSSSDRTVAKSSKAPSTDQEQIRWACWPRRADIERKLSSGRHSIRRELVLRLRLWWFENDERRALPPGESEPLNPDNLEVILRLLNPARPLEMLMNVEIHRELGRFDQAWDRMLQIRGAAGCDRICDWQAHMIDQGCPWLIRFPPLNDLVTPRFRNRSRSESGRVYSPLLSQARGLAQWADRFIEMPRPEEPDTRGFPDRILESLNDSGSTKPSHFGWFGKVLGGLREK